MDSQLSDDDAAQSARRKGKLRADPEESTESTPLLISSHPPLVQEVTPSNGFRHRRLLVLLSTIFLSTLALVLIVAIFIFVLTYSYNAKLTNAVRDEVLGRAVVIRGPDRIDVLNATEGSIWVQVDMRVGVDAGTAIDVVLESDNKERLDFGATAIRRSLGRWLIRRMHMVTVSTDKASLYSMGMLMANITMPSVTIPLTLDRPDDASWLTTLSLPVQVNVTNNTADLNMVARESWKSGFLSVSALIHNISINGGMKGEDSWRRRLNVEQNKIIIPSRLKVPNLPGLPSPGRGTPFPEFSELVTLESFNVSSVNHSISIKASASVVDPLPASFHMRVPSLPFVVSLSDTNSSDAAVTVATGSTEPFSLTHPNITLHLNGTVPPLPRSSSPLLSAFLSAYLAGVDAPIVVGSPLLPALKLPAVFPAPHPKPQILRDVHIRNMRITLRGESVLASGTIFARVVLPSGIFVEVDAQKIWPDVLVFDGEVPSDDEDDDEAGNGLSSFYHGSEITSESGHFPISFPSHKHKKDKERATIPKEPLPTPLPPRAFARIRPEDWLPAHSVPLSGTGAAYEVTAQVVDVPLEVLPGRDRLLRSFVSKVLFGGRAGALAGVKGTAAVAVAVDGLPVRDDNGDEDKGGHVMELTGLPFSGSVRVGRKGL